ncbi:guanine deaminase [Rhizobiales bacterium GAS191]|jgi:guanine deaminase|nr:guanine deaminase [Rhizobiales bacterium GAS113]SEE06705.1 guanine deaminase [Rhizobiales bacterium GAS191]
MSGRKILRGRLLWFVADPQEAGAQAHRYVEDGAVLISDGKVREAGEAGSVLAQAAPGTPVEDHRPHLIMPGFIDPHIHFPQTQVVASYGAQLLEWLIKYTFVEEQKFHDPAHCARNARFFFDELLRNGTTTAVAFCSVHAQSAEAFFAESARRNTLMLAGKVMMDRNAPEGLRDTPQRGYDQSKALIAKWHGRGRQLYAIAPRFAVTSSEAQLEAAGALAREHPDCHVETHLAENHAEIALVKELFPWSRDYTDVYERYGLLGPKSLLGHCIHLGPRERSLLAERGSVAVFCPTSNLFIGSGLFDWRATREAGLRIGLATDIGGGTSYSMLQTAAEAYKVLQLQGQNLPALQAFHAMTRGNALALGLEDRIGSFEMGRACDAVVLDAGATPAMRHRMETARSLDEELFVLMTMGSERNIAATYVMGEKA